VDVTVMLFLTAAMRCEWCVKVLWCVYELVYVFSSELVRRPFVQVGVMSLEYKGCKNVEADEVERG